MSFHQTRVSHSDYTNCYIRPPRSIRLARLESWPLQQPTTAEGRRRIAETFPFVKRAFEVPHEHSFLGAVGAYRVAMTSTFVDATPILLCAALEALAADFNSAVVIRRLVPRHLISTEDSVAPGTFGNALSSSTLVRTQRADPENERYRVSEARTQRRRRDCQGDSARCIG